MYVNGLNVNNLAAYMKVRLGGANMLTAFNNGYNFTPQKRYDLLSNIVSQVEMYLECQQSI